MIMTYPVIGLNILYNHIKKFLFCIGHLITGLMLGKSFKIYYKIIFAKFIYEVIK